jgi:ComF family protein
VRALGPHQGALAQAVHQLKYRAVADLARELATRLQPALTPDQTLVPVPLHPDRERERGFNQAQLLAVALARGSGLPLARALVRTRPTRSQVGLSAAARRQNVQGAFAALPPVPPRAVLIDDVITTGATLRECARALRQAGAQQVSALVVAFAPLPAARSAPPQIA